MSPRVRELCQDAGEQMHSRPICDLPLFLRADETAAVLRVSIDALYDARKNGDLRAVRVGRALRFPRTEIERLLCGGPGPDSPAPATTTSPRQGERPDEQRNADT